MNETDKKRHFSICLPINIINDLLSLVKSCFWAVELILRPRRSFVFGTNQLLQHCKGMISMKISPVWDKAMTLATVKDGFKERNIYPFNPNTIHEESSSPSSLFANIPPMKNSVKSGNEISILGTFSEKQSRHTPPSSSMYIETSLQTLNVIFHL